MKKSVTTIMVSKTKHVFENYVITESFYCMSRTYLVQSKNRRLLCDFISFTIAVAVIGIITIDILSDVNIGFRAFQGVTLYELFFLAINARFSKIASKSLERLDESCPLNARGLSKLDYDVITNAVMLVVSFVFDIIGLKLLDLNNTSVILLSMGFTAHDAELSFLSMLFDSINVRLEMLKDSSPVAGSRRFGHILIASAYLSEQCAPALLLLLGSTLFTTVIYQFLLLIADADTIFNLSLYLVWRESRSMYSLWIFCKTVAKCDTICNDLQFILIGRLVLDKNISKEKNRSQYKIVRRWHSVLSWQQPSYISGSILSIGLSTPIILIDLSINYTLIVVQMYLAYK